MDIKDLLISVLERFSYPVKLQGAMAEDEKYPPSFFTFWNNDTLSSDFYNNIESSIVWDFDLNFYSTDPLLINSILIEVKNELKKVGFIVSGCGYDVISDESSHTGRGINIKYIEKRKKNDRGTRI